jgi:hypothetical protein
MGRSIEQNLDGRLQAEALIKGCPERQNGLAVIEISASAHESTMKPRSESNKEKQNLRPNRPGNCQRMIGPVGSLPRISNL